MKRSPVIWLASNDSWARRLRSWRTSPTISRRLGQSPGRNPGGSRVPPSADVPVEEPGEAAPCVDTIEAVRSGTSTTNAQTVSEATVRPTNVHRNLDRKTIAHRVKNHPTKAAEKDGKADAPTHPTDAGPVAAAVNVETTVRDAHSRQRCRCCSVDFC